MTDPFAYGRDKVARQTVPPQVLKQLERISTVPTSGLSRELQIGKAGEHLIVADLLLQGYSAFLSDQGMPYDVVIEIDHNLRRMQVKSTLGLFESEHQGSIYRFGTRRGKAGYSSSNACDYFAFVALDTREIGYLTVRFLLSSASEVVQIIEFKSKRVEYAGRIYSNGTRRTPDWGRYLQDYSRFLP